MANDPVLKPVRGGLGPNLQSLKGMDRTGDGQSNPGPGIAAARTMTGGGAQDASTAGGLKADGPGKYAHLPDPIRGLINRNLARDPDPQDRT